MTELAIVMPVGPSHGQEFVRDTIETFVQFLPGARLIVLDDSRGVFARDGLPEDTTIIATRDGYAGMRGQLYRRLSLGFSEALQRPCDVVLRIDTDALVTGSSFVARAAEAFSANPRIGALGSHRVGYTHGPRSFRPPARRILSILTVRAPFRPARALRYARLIARARDHGYLLGEHIMGGVTIYNPQALRALEANGLLDDARLGRSQAEEDSIFGLALMSLGFELRSFGAHNDDLPFGVAWSGLPAAPHDLIAARKELIHSTKVFRGLDEQAIRRTFRQARERGASKGRQ